MDYLDFKFGVAKRLLVQLEEVRTENDQKPSLGTRHLTNEDFNEPNSTLVARI